MSHFLKSGRLPKYRHHKGSGQAFVQISGRRHYLGKYDTEESQERYRRVIAELVTTPCVVQTAASPSIGECVTVVELAAAFWQFAAGYYVKDGKPTDHLSSVRVALRLLRQLYGRVPADQFGPLSFRAVQQTLVDAGNTRSYINHICGVIRRVFKWAASQELVPVTVYQALATVPGLKKGRTPAREPAPVLPVHDDVVDATLPHLPAVLADMVRFQRLTGARPSEVCLLRPCDLDRSGDVWAYRPHSHKAEHHGRERVIFIGPKAQAILLPYLLRDAQTYCFSPVESEKARKAEMRACRKTKVQPSQRDRQKARPKRKPRDRYTKDSYNRAIRRAVERANKDRVGEDTIARWTPNQLRHKAGTEIRRQYGLEAAQVTLGHARADVTQVYAERDFELAKKVMKKIG